MKTRAAAASKSSSRRRRYANAEGRWAAVVRKDEMADGFFYYAVKTTGIYCRPSCPSRLARRENVVFYQTCGQAEAAGYRACQRCCPDGPSLAERRARTVATACALIERSFETPGLHEIAFAVGMSPFHLHRIFKQATGMTLKAYARAHRATRLRDELSRRIPVTAAVYGAGYNSSSRFDAESSQVLGMKPSRFRRGGVGETIRFAVGQCTLGSILVASSVKGICAILLGDAPDTLVKDLQDRFPRASLVGGDADFEQMVANVVGFVELPQAALSLPLDVRGTAFQQRVWQALQAVPAGATVSYADVARRIGQPRAVRAVARACGANALAVAIPCHRVVRTDGSLSGYRWGVERKRTLLNRETG